MPVLPAWLVELLIKVALPIILNEMLKSGMIDEAEKVAIKFGVGLSELKSYPEYPTGKNGATEGLDASN